MAAVIGEKTQTVDRFWQRCRRDHAITTNNYHACTLADPEFLDLSVPSLDLSDQPRLIGGRKKRGTAHLVLDFQTSRVPRRAAGDYWVILNYDNSPLFLVRVTDVMVAPFNEVPESWAAVEGEGDSSLPWWQDAHREYYTRQCAKWGIEWREDLPTVCETWELMASADR